MNFFDFGLFYFLFREIFLENEYYFYSIIKNPLIIDCGANIGIATLYFKWLYPESIIYAFEPDPQTFALLKKNIKQNNLKNVFLYNVALSDKDGEIDFYIDKEKPGWLTMSTIKDRMPKDKIIVRSVKLSEYIKDKKIDFLKMDIEGSEIMVLNESKKYLKNIKEMVVEYHRPVLGQPGKFEDITLRTGNKLLNDIIG